MKKIGLFLMVIGIMTIETVSAQPQNLDQKIDSLNTAFDVLIVDSINQADSVFSLVDSAAILERLIVEKQRIADSLENVLVQQQQRTSFEYKFKDYDYDYDYDSIPWVQIPADKKDSLNAFVSKAAYNTSVSITANQMVSMTLVNDVPSRSGKIVDQVWIVVIQDGQVVDCLFSMSNLPTIVEKTGTLTITAYMGDSKALTKLQKKTSKQAFQRNPW